MNTRVISYSLTGNNDILAQYLAEAISAEHIRITEPKERTGWKIALDMLFNRIPAVNYSSGWTDTEGTVILVAPIWMGCAASPMRDCFRILRRKGGSYYFVSISGGADENPNPQIAADLRKRLRKEPAAVIDMHIAGMLPPEPKPTRDDTSIYRITPAEAKTLAAKAVSILHKEGM